MITASAPGKAVLSGEYVVLDGAPAVAMALDRRAVVRVSRSLGDWHSVAARGFTETEGRFLLDGRRIEWLAGASEFGLVDAVLRCVDLALPEPLSIELDTEQFVDARSGRKIGIGSSAALTVALIAALRRSEDVLDDALKAHRQFQLGKGSGVDVATSACGGLIEYRAVAAAVRRLRWPDGLAGRLLFSGVAANTVKMLDRLNAAAEQPSRRALAEYAVRMAKAWQSADSVLAEFPGYIEALRKFSVDHDLGIFDAGHEAVAKQAESAGLVYKPCGAGGGDVGILLGRSEAALDEFLAGDSRSLACGLDSQGIRLYSH